VFLIHVSPFHTPGQHKTSATPQSCFQEGNRSKRWGGRAPAGASEEEEGDGGEPGPVVLGSNSGYADLSCFDFHVHGDAPYLRVIILGYLAANESNHWHKACHTPVR